MNQEVQVLVVPRRKHTTSRLYEIFPLVRAFINFQAEDVPEAAQDGCNKMVNATDLDLMFGFVKYLKVNLKKKVSSLHVGVSR